MEGSVAEKEYSLLGSLFQQIINDMKNGTPIWEDFIAKATKLHTVLKTVLSAVTSYLDAFQKIADAATNARGATKDIGLSLTRMCLRHKAMETRMKAFTCAIMECLVNPLQEKLEDWKKTLINIDKDHTREYKRARQELKKRSTDTLRLQKKAKKGKGSDLQRRVETCLQDVNERRQILEDAEKKAVRAAMVEERSRFCYFVSLLKPVVDSEVAMLSEMSHLQEGTGQLLRHTSDPHTLPPASEQVISDLQAASGQWSPPPSPLTGRATSSSLCSSISSLASSSSGSASGSGPSTLPSSTAGQPPSSNNLQCPSQPHRLGSVSSRDSGFTSQDTLHLPPLVEFPKGSDNTSAASSCSTPIGVQPGSDTDVNGGTWPHMEDTMQFQRAASAIMSDRPHTISTAYEKGHIRPMLSVHTFTGVGSDMNISGSASQPVSPCGGSQGSPNLSRQGGGIYARPPLPTRCSSLERPVVPAKGPPTPGAMTSLPEHKMAKPTSLPPHLTKDVPQATYVNMFELASMAASRANANMVSANNQEAGSTPQSGHDKACESSTSESSLESSSGYGSQGACNMDDSTQHQSYNNDFPLVDIQIASDTSQRLSMINWKEDSSTTITISNNDSSHSQLQNSSMSISLTSLEEAVKSIEDASSPKLFATIKKTKPCVPKRRPLSMTATCPPSSLRLSMGGGRRGSSGSGIGMPGVCGPSSNNNNKPPPPVRRSSSITRPHHLHHAINEYGSNQQLSMVDQENDESLPPPPAFLLHPHQQSQQEAAPMSSRCSTPTLSNAAKGINVAETVKALTELKHTPASPSVLRRNAALQQQQQNQAINQQPTSNNGSSHGLSSFQQSKSTFTALQNNTNVNPIYGQTGLKIFTYVEQTSTVHSRNSTFTAPQNSGIYGTKEVNNTNNADVYDNGKVISSNYSATVTYSSSPNTSNYSESMSTFGHRPSQSGNHTPSTPIYGQTMFGKQVNNISNQQGYEKKTGNNTIYAQPSEIIAGFNNLGFHANRSHDGNMSPLSLRKAVTGSRSQSADRRGSDVTGGGGGLIAAISARLAPQLSPRTPRRSLGGDSEHYLMKGSQDSLYQSNSMYGQSLSQGHHKNAHAQKANSSVTSSVQPAFLDKLSATLRHRQASGSPNKACSVRQLINNKAQPDPRVCHGSLMEQIKRGATLRRNKQCNDRSAPKIR